LSKTIKLDDQVYERLEKLIIHRETFSHVVERLLRLYDTMTEVKETLGPNHYLMERPIVDARAKETLDRRGDRPKVSDVPIQ